MCLRYISQRCKNTQVEIFEAPLSANTNADRVSRTGAPKYFLIVTHSTFQSHCRALAMCLFYFLFTFRTTAKMMLPIHLWINMQLDSDWGRGQILWPDPIAILYMRAYILYSLCIYFIINCSFSMHLHLFKIIYIYTKHERYFKGLVIILIIWCPPIGWCPRALAQSRLWIIRCCAHFRPHVKLLPLSLKSLPDCLILTPPLTPPPHLTLNLPILGG